MKKLILLVILFCSFYFMSAAQVPNWQWAQTIQGAKDDNGRSIATDSKSNVVMVGDFLSDSIASGSQYFPNVNPTGGVINQYKMSDIFVSKYDSLGSILWTKTFGGDSIDIAACVAIDHEDNIIVVGKFNGNTMQIGGIVLTKPIGQVAPDAFIFKLDPNGNVLWAINVGGTSVEEGKAVTTDEYDNIYMAGLFWSANVNFGANTFSSAGLDDIFITKYSSTGTAIWTKTFGSASSESVVDICADKQGYVYFTGEYRASNLTIGTLLPGNLDSSPTTEVYVSKMDNNGNIMWTKTANCSGSDYVKGVGVDLQKNVLITGRFADFYINIDGNIFPGDQTNNPSCTNGSGFFLIKFDSVGTFQWFQTISISIEEVGLSVKTDKDNNIFVAAFGKGDTLMIDTMMVYNIPNSATLLLKYDPNGHIIWQKTFGEADHQGYGDTETDIDISKEGILYLGSTFFKQTYAMDSITATNSNSFTTDPIIAKIGLWDSQITDILHYTFNHGYNVFPNPTKDIINIQVNEQNAPYNISLWNVQGQFLKEWKVQKGNVCISFGDIQSGIYFLKFSNSSWVETTRIIVY
jgi:hypothetical protein